MTLLCPYRNLFGAPGAGVHAARLFGLARNDLLATAAAAALLTWSLSRWAPEWAPRGALAPLRTLILVFLGLWALGFAAHLLFCVRTPLTAPFMA